MARTGAGAVGNLVGAPIRSVSQALSQALSRALMLVVSAVTISAWSAAGTAAVPLLEQGASLYASRCAGCHDNQAQRVPGRASLAQRRPDEIVASATVGAMREQAKGLTVQQIQAIAGFLSANRSAQPIDTSNLANGCRKPPADLLPGPGQWNGWANGLRNERYQPAPGISVQDVPRLKVKWVFAYDASMTVGQPSVIGDRIFVTTQLGQVIALDAHSGCAWWSVNNDSPVRTAVIVGPTPAASSGIAAGSRLTAYFGDERATVHSVDAQTGRRQWSVRLDQHVAARITGTPMLVGNRLYVPVSSGEEGWAQRASYECCTFRGSLVALDAADGAVLWRTYMIADEPKPYRRNAAGAQQYGPAGAAVWSSPTYDEQRGLLYVGTGNSYTDVGTSGSNAIVAIDAKNGQIRWTNQVLPNDNYVMPCLRPGVGPGVGNCPNTLGPDFDFGASPILVNQSNGKAVLLAGQKSGILYALDPDDQGRKRWQQNLGAGTALGGIQWGMASDATTVYVPMADAWRANAQTPKPGLHAVRIDDGKPLWHAPAAAAVCAWGLDRCVASMSAAAAAIPGIVFTGAHDGHLRAHSASDGQVLWDFDTAADEYDAVNGRKARGGSIDNGGPVIAAGMVLVNSGYGRQLARGGNALFVFSVDGR